MLTPEAIERIRAHEGSLFQKWLKEHVEPRVLAIEEMVKNQPMTDIYTGAILDKCITPFVYWAAESTNQPYKSQATSTPPVTGSSSSVPGSSLSQTIPPGFKEKYGLISVSDGVKERIDTTRRLGDDWKTVNKQLKDWGYWSHQSQSEGKIVWYWERRVGA